ncbi:MAG: murein biosynthesis integral membrane protein MurJ [Verrucomicrobia bacterium]|nr:murein biosynthesis integral membrane protein MurJ [Verrucomicrobiota bacterium]
MSKSLKNIGVVASATMVSRILGLGRDMLVTAVFGTSALASSFYTAFTLPNLFRRLLGEGALTAALVPTLNEELKHRARAGAFALVNQVASWLFVVTGSLVVLAMAALWPVVRFSGDVERWGVDAGTALRWLAAADLAVVLFPYLVFVCLAAVFSAALQTLHRFLEPALSPIWLNVSMLVLLGGAAYAGWSTTSEGRMLWLCGGALLGGVLQMAVPAAALMSEGWRPRFDLSASDPLRQIVRLMVPTVFGSAIYLINMAVARIFGLSLNDSAVTILNLATRLMELPIGVFAVAISTVIFPLISKHAAAGDWDNLALSYRKGMRLILVINVPAAAGMMILAVPIIRLLFQRGAFAAGDTALMQPVLAVFAFGLPFFSFVNIVLRAFYAQKDTATPVRAALISFLVNLGLSLALMRPLGTVGLAIASNVAIVAQAVYLQWHLARKHPGLAFHHVGNDLAKVVVASAVMGFLVAAGWWGWARLVPATTLSDACALAGLIGGGIGAYAALLWLLKIEGRDDLAAILAKFRARFS